LANLGKYNDAIDYFSIALKLNPNAEDAKKNRQIAIDKLKNRF
jgi:tetratricopeptide (TPR) repeat protein